MSIKQKLGMALGMEDDAPNVQVNIDTDEGGMPLDEVAPIEDSNEFEPTVAADAEEIEEQAEDIEEDDVDMQNLHIATESLLSTYVAMEKAQRNGGLTAEAAEFAAISVESVMGRYNVAASEVGIALESFGNNKSRATTVSMEGVMDTLRDIWATIVEKFKAMCKKIADFYQKTIAAAPRIKRRAESLRNKAQKTSGAAKESKIKTGLFGQLNIAGDLPTAEKIINGLKNARIAFDKNVSKASIEEKLKTVFNVDSFAAGSAFDVNAFKSAMSVSETKFALPGNRKLVNELAADTTSATGSDAAAAVNAWEFGIVEDKAGVKNDKDARDKEFDVLSTTEVANICQEVINNMQEIINFKTQATREFNTAKYVEKEGEKLLAKLAKHGTGDAKGANEPEARKFLNAMASGYRKAQAGKASIVRYNYAASKAALAYCARSLSQYRD